MYQDEIFENALKKAKEEDYHELRKEVSAVEALIEQMLTKFLECSTSSAERDFHVCAL